MNLAAIIHRSTFDYIYPKSNHSISIKIQTAKNDVKNIYLNWWFRSNTNEKDVTTVKINKKFSDKYSDYYMETIETHKLSAYVRYCFVLDDGNRKLLYGPNGFEEEYSRFNDNFFEFLWPNKSDSYFASDWCDSQIYYQIFPERFKNGDNSLTPDNALPWGSPPSRKNFMGGDLKGIIDQLDYIKDLGATCLYLTPIFMAPSNHKYDTVDYYEIDKSFGNKDDLRKLVDEVHKRGMKILLDGVFNHCGYYWPIFQDVVKNGSDSKYADWFFIENYPVSLKDVNYHCVGHYKWMPKINLNNYEAAEYFISVGEYWLSEFNTDGWRLDVADEVPVSFWQKFSSRIKRINPNALLLGETWKDAGNLLSLNRLDTAMNYLFKDAMVGWVGKSKINVSKFDHLINSMYARYPDDVIHRLYNPLDSHDTARFLYECSNNIERFLVAIALQMSMPGCPAIFYGDEIGLSGENDPGCRLCMQWDDEQQNIKILNWYKKLISIRKSSLVFSKGDYQTLICDDENNTYVFRRNYRDESIVVITNLSDKDISLKIPIEKSKWSDMLEDSYITENAYGVFVKIAANSVHILRKGEK